MPLDGNGSYTPPTPEYPVISGEYILASDFNTIILDLGAALSSALYRDGQAPLTANFAAGGFKLTGLGVGSATTDSVTYGQVFEGSSAYTGTHDYAGATLLTLTQVPADNSTKVASTAFVQQAAFSAALPALPNDGKRNLPLEYNNAVAWQAQATQAEAEAGTAVASWMSPERTAQAIAALDPDYIPTIFRSARTSNTILDTADNGTLIDITSGTFTQTITAAATLGNGWYCYIRNSGTGDITLDPDASELIDGLDSYIMYPGETRLVQCDGTALYSVVLSGFLKEFTASGTFVKPPGYKAFSGLAWSGGGAGQRTGALAAQSTGGAGGGCMPFTFESSRFAASNTITIGAGAAAQTAADTGTSGGNTYITAATLTLINIYGGQGGNQTYDSLNTVGGGLVVTLPASGVTRLHLPEAETLYGQTGFAAACASTTAIPNTVWGGAAPYRGTGTLHCGGSWYGGAAGGSVNASDAVSANGESIYGGNGGAASSAANGTDGAAPGGGGGATQTGTQSGAGARGELRIWGVI